MPSGCDQCSSPMRFAPDHFWKPTHEYLHLDGATKPTWWVSVSTLSSRSRRWIWSPTTRHRIQEGTPCQWRHAHHLHVGAHLAASKVARERRDLEGVRVEPSQRDELQWPSITNEPLRASGDLPHKPFLAQLVLKPLRLRVGHAGGCALPAEPHRRSEMHSAYRPS